MSEDIGYVSTVAPIWTLTRFICLYLHDLFPKILGVGFNEGGGGTRDVDVASSVGLNRTTVGKGRLGLTAKTVSETF